ncbi:hypothetical protein [Reichenbachiella sp. MALMAid0571]
MDKNQLNEEVKIEMLKLIRENKITEAMKVVMDALGCGLREAKEIVDQYR